MEYFKTRYVRWFGTKLPLFSSVVIYTILVVLAWIWAFGVSFSGPPPTIMFEIPIITLALILGVVSYVFIHLLLMIRFKNELDNQTIDDMISSIERKLDDFWAVNIWVRNSEELFITSVVNPFFSAIIISSAMVERLQERPNDGEVVLAYHYNRINHRPIVPLLASAIGFYLSSIPAALFIVPLVFSLAYMISYLGLLYGLFILIYLVVPVLGIFLLALLMRSIAWRHEKASDVVWDLYDVHPQIAKYQLEKTELDSEGKDNIIWQIREWEQGKRSARKVSATLLASVGPFFAIYFTVILFFPGLLFYATSQLVLFLIYGVPFIGGLLVYFFLGRWDKDALANDFYRVSEVQEPFW